VSEPHHLTCTGPVVLLHSGAGGLTEDLLRRCADHRAALAATIARARVALEDGGDAVAAVLAAVTFMEDEVDLFNAGRGSVLCRDGTVEMSAGLMRGSDRAAGAVANLRTTRRPIHAAHAVLTGSPHVLLAGPAADGFAEQAGLEQRSSDYFVTERQRRRLAGGTSDFVGGTVGAVCLDGQGRLAAATSTGGRPGQWPGRVGDTPSIGAGTWADDRVAVSCTGDGEAFIRAGASRRLALDVSRGSSVDDAGAAALADVAAAGGTGGLIAVTASGEVTLRFTTGAMGRVAWRHGSEPEIWVVD
jgi:beta-aspartyl-peptidase (threonine type)